jgi:hypothetical protein
MQVLARLHAGGDAIDFGIASTLSERAEVLAQRFRVCQRYGYYRAGLAVDQDEHDATATYVIAVVSGLMVGSARIVQGNEQPGFRFPLDAAFAFEPPDLLRDVPPGKLYEVGRVVAEHATPLAAASLVIPLGLIHVVAHYAEQHELVAGLACIKQRLLRVLRRAGVAFRDVPAFRLIYPRDGVGAGYYHRDADPPVPIYWLPHEIIPSVERAIARYRRPEFESTRRIDAKSATR